MSSRDEVNQLWKHRWAQGRTAWHKDQVNPHLEEFFTRFEGDTHGKNILVPLCGKSVDLKWLHERGMNVLGLEYVEKPIKEFFEGHTMVYTVEESQILPGCNIFKHGDRLTIYQCDIFSITSELFGCSIDFLWDRGSLVAIEYENKRSYSEVIQSVLSSTAQGLMEIIGFDRALHPGPPYSTTETDVDEFFGERFAIEKLSDRKCAELPEWYASKFPGLSESHYKTIYIQRKK